MTLLAIWLINKLIGKIKGALYHSKHNARIMLSRLLPNKAYQALFMLWMFLKSLIKKPSYSTRVYLRAGLDYETFIGHLNGSGIDYVILRWFEDWPAIEDDEDIDILVSDAHLATIRSFCVPYENGCQKLDIYSQTGCDNSGYYGASYFPEKLATALLENRVLYKDSVYVPSGKTYFLSLAYHCVCHKGYESGLPKDKASTSKDDSDHDYFHILSSEAEKSGMSDTDITLADLYHLLEKHNSLPQTDTLALLARYNQWLFDHLNDKDPIDDMKKGDVIVFVIRQWAHDNHKIDEILQAITDEKLLIIDHVPLTDPQIKLAKQTIRGGQWDAGPYPKSGGAPYSLIICFDYAPKTPNKKTQKIYPFMTNERVLLKHQIRDSINKQLLLWRQVNCMHSSDNETEATDYLSILEPEKQSAIHAKIAAIRTSSYFNDWPIQEVYVENGTRAKTCLIDVKGNSAVLKLFKPEAKRFFEREVFVYREFASELSQLPKIVEIGDNYFITEFYENQLAGKTKNESQAMIKEHSHTILRFLKFFYDKGYAILGFYPGNLIITPENKLIIIDFEFLQQYQKRPDSFAQSYDLVGVPKDFEGDMPRGDSNHTLKNTWNGYLDDKVISEFLA